MNAALSMTRQILASMGQKLFDGKRDLYEIFGYKKTITSKDYRFRYERGDISTRIVEAYPLACWSTPPMPINDEDSQENSPWEQDFLDFAKRLKLWGVVRRADVLAQLNEYAVIVIGVSGEDTMDKPLTGKPEIIYLRALGADNAPIDSWVDNENDPRFGLPETYKLELSSNRKKSSKTTKVVHHSRVIHIAERTLDDPCIGKPYLEHIWNKLDDLDKVAGSSAEIWWLNGRAGLNLNIDAEADLDPDDAKNLKEQTDAYQHKLTRVIRTKGVDVKPISMDVADPSNHVDIHISLISGATGIPKRILMGSERGELSSNQDENNFDSRTKERRSIFCEPELLDPMMQKFIDMGAIADEEYTWDWPELNTLSKKDAAEVADKLSKAITAYANSPTAESLISVQQFVEEVLGLKYRPEELVELLDLEDAEIEIDDNE